MEIKAKAKYWITLVVKKIAVWSKVLLNDIHTRYMW
jgi:hypothetical protein